jgi:hypothetical protein
MNELDDLFSGNLENKMDFLNETTKQTNDGVYKVDLSKVKDKKKGWRSVVRFLPNLTQEGKLGQSAIEKISHYVDIKQEKELSGYFDSPKNFGEKCPLTDLYYTMLNSKNAILVEKAKMLKYSKKYFSYVLVIEDEQQPELVGKILVYQYGKTIKDKILAEKNGTISGEPCNVFDITNGKDFVLVAKEIQTGDITYPDYKMSMFKPTTSTLSLYSKDKQAFKNVPLNEEGKIDTSIQSKVKEFLVERDVQLEDFAPKKLEEKDFSKINEITAFLTGKASASFAAKQSKSSDVTSDDLGFDEDVTTGAVAETASPASTTEDEDDFFSDF